MSATLHHTEGSVTKIDDMCAILKRHLITADEYTDCAIVYRVTFDQLRNIYDEGRAVAQPAPKTALSYFADDVEAAMAQESGWRPIETAPKDGQLILLCKGRFVVPGWWDAAERMHQWRLVDSTDADEDDTVQLNGWMADSPTFWLPLPPAPNQGEAS